MSAWYDNDVRTFREQELLPSMVGKWIILNFKKYFYELWKSRAILIRRARQLVQDFLVAVEVFKHWPLMTTQLRNAISSSFTVDNRFDLVCG